MNHLNQKKYFKLYACNILVKGYTESCIYDLQRASYYKVPNSFYPLLERLEQEPPQLVLAECGEDLTNNIQGFINQLVDEEIGFFTDEPDSFPPIDFSYESPYELLSCTIEIGSDFPLNSIDEVLDALSETACQHLSLLIIEGFARVKETLVEILEATEDSRLKCIDLVLPFETELVRNAYLDKVVRKHQRIRKVTVFDSPKEARSTKEIQQAEVCYTNCAYHELFQNLDLHSHFAINIHMFSEAQHRNSYYNRKLFIDDRGQIKNGMFTEEFFGRLGEVGLIETVRSEAFQKLWFVRKDDILVCQGCEFRYMCVDNQQLLKKTRGYERSTECRYNPYIAKWSDDEGYLCIAECIKENVINF